MAKTQCPACGGSNFYITPQNSITGYCFNCGHTEFGKGGYKAVERFEDVKGLREFYKEIAEYYHTSLTEEARNYLHSRGINDRLIDQLRIGYCPSDAHVLYQDVYAKPSGLINQRGKPFLADRITFPYLVKNQVTDLRGRSLEKTTEYRYLSPKGSSYYRGADYPYLYEGEATLITEGEIKAIFAREAGFPTHGIPGINSMRPRTNGAITCFDSSRKPRSKAAVFRAIIHLARVFPSIKVCQLPLTGSEQDVGIDDYILKHGVEAFQKLVHRALPIETWKRIHVI